jgi:hypothetical protein
VVEVAGANRSLPGDKKTGQKSLLAGNFSNFFWRVHFGKLNASNRSSSAGEFSGI